MAGAEERLPSRLRASGGDSDRYCMRVPTLGRRATESRPSLSA